MIIAVAVSSGFRNEIRGGISSVSGDIQLQPLNMNLLDSASPVEKDASYIPHIRQMEGVSEVIPVIYRAGIVKNGNDIHGTVKLEAVVSCGLALEEANVESRPLWKPMHLQPVFADCDSYLNGVSESLFNKGLCLPAGPWVSDEDIALIVDTIKSMLKR